MYPIIADLHTHTLSTTHAFHTLDAMAAEAAALGYRALAVTDHAPAMPDAPHIWHFQNQGAVDRRVQGVVMLFGAEGPGLSEKGVSMADDVVYISQFGSVRSINAGAAAAVAMHCWIAQRAM